MHLRRKKKFIQPSPPPGMSERREGYRREDDQEVHTVAEHTTENAWWIARLLRWGKVAGAVVACSLVLNSVATALNIRMAGTRDDLEKIRGESARNDTVLKNRIDLNSAAILSIRQQTDSVVSLLTQLNIRTERIQMIYCFTIPNANRSFCRGQE